MGDTQNPGGYGYESDERLRDDFARAERINAERRALGEPLLGEPQPGSRWTHTNRAGIWTATAERLRPVIEQPDGVAMVNERGEKMAYLTPSKWRPVAKRCPAIVDTSGHHFGREQCERDAPHVGQRHLVDGVEYDEQPGVTSEPSAGAEGDALAEMRAYVAEQAADLHNDGDDLRDVNDAAYAAAKDMLAIAERTVPALREAQAARDAHKAEARPTSKVFLVTTEIGEYNDRDESFETCHAARETAEAAALALVNAQKGASWDRLDRPNGGTTWRANNKRHGTHTVNVVPLEVLP